MCFIIYKNSVLAQARQKAQFLLNSSYTVQTANVYPSAIPTVQPVKKSAMFAGVFFLLASLLEFVSLYTRYSLHLSLNRPQCSPSLHRCIALIAGNRTQQAVSFVQAAVSG